jgi:SAM-dependent methyltransferase
VTTFKDHFSGHAADYAKFRPSYPPELFDYLAFISPQRMVAWDCATGNGQAATGLAQHFAKVIATDASARQIESAQPHPSISYRVVPAEASGIDPDSVDLILVAQALHWFDLDRFFMEAKRVAKENGILGVSNYLHLSITPEIDAIVSQFYHETTGPHWPPERKLVETNFETIRFPFPELPPRQFEMRQQWNLAQLTGYLRTWSATKKFIAARGFDPVDPLMPELRSVWPDWEHARQVTWPLKLRTFRVQSGASAFAGSGARSEQKQK